MEFPTQVTFRNVPNPEAVEADIRERAAKLDTYYARIVGCRVVVEVPHRHHRGGNQYHVRIELSVPGGEVVVNHEPSLYSSEQALGHEKLTKDTEPNGVHRDLPAAIHEAFDVARRRLQDYARRQRGK